MWMCERRKRRVKKRMNCDKEFLIFIWRDVIVQESCILQKVIIKRRGNGGGPSFLRWDHQ
jgi:hypothetical protein